MSRHLVRTLAASTALALAALRFAVAVLPRTVRALVGVLGVVGAVLLGRALLRGLRRRTVTASTDPPAAPRSPEWTPAPPGHPGRGSTGHTGPVRPPRP